MNRLGLIYLLLLIITASCSSQWSKRDKDLQPELVLDTVGVKAGMVIGEVGAGEGYLTFKLSRRVGEGGKIYANDIKSSVLKAISKRAEEEGITNIETVLGQEKDPVFPEDSLDMVIMILAYHDIVEKVPFMINVKKYIKPGAPVVIIDRDPDRWGHGHDHFMTKEELIESVQKADYELARLETFPRISNIYIFYPL